MWFQAPKLGIRDRISNLNRMRQVVQALANHGFLSLIDQIGLSDGALVDPAPQEPGTARVGRRLALALGELGPTFVKFGQLLATREDLLPAAVTAELATLQDRVPPMPEAAVRARIEQGLGRPISELFHSFSAEPFAAASISQVHRASTFDGRAVVVKVQRVGIAEIVAQDLALLHQLAELLAERVEGARRFDPKGLAAEFAEGLQRELDFRLEAEACRRMRRAVGDTARVPAVIDSLSCETVLTLEFVDGRKVNRVTDPPVRRALAQRILRSFVHQILSAGYFHADPHPGNLIALSGGDALALLDLGAVGTIDAPTRAALFRVAAAAASRDGRAFARALLGLVEQTEPIDRAAFEADVVGFMDRLLARNLREVPLAEITGALFDLLRTHGLRTRAEYFTLVRALTILDGVLRELDPRLDPLRAAAPFILRSTVATGEWAPAASLAGSLIRARWGRDPTFRTQAIGAAVTMAAAGIAWTAFGLWLWLW